MLRAAFGSTLYVLGSFGHRWPTRWSQVVKVKPSKRWRRVCLWGGLVGPRRSPTLSCGFAAQPQAMSLASRSLSTAASSCGKEEINHARVFTHVAFYAGRLQEKLDGKVADWMEHLTRRKIS